MDFHPSPDGPRSRQSAETVCSRPGRSSLRRSALGTGRDHPELIPSERKSMATSVSSYLLRRLTDWGVRRVFGYAGDGINGVVHAFSHFEDRLKFVQVRHEEMAAFMACAHAKY